MHSKVGYIASPDSYIHCSDKVFLRLMESYTFVKFERELRNPNGLEWLSVILSHNKEETFVLVHHLLVMDFLKQIVVVRHT